MVSSLSLCLGLTETYVRSRGVSPVRVTMCYYVTDAFEHGTSVAHLVERWDQSRGSGDLQYPAGLSPSTHPAPPPSRIGANLNRG
jgi:hypothetical protein